MPKLKSCFIRKSWVHAVHKRSIRRARLTILYTTASGLYQTDVHKQATIPRSVPSFAIQLSASLYTKYTLVISHFSPLSTGPISNDGFLKELICI